MSFLVHTSTIFYLDFEGFAKVSVPGNRLVRVYYVNKLSKIKLFFSVTCTRRDHALENIQTINTSQFHYWL